MTDPLTSKIEVYPVVVDDEPQAHAISWTCGNQRFRIGPDYWENREEAESFARMFQHALDVYRAADNATATRWQDNHIVTTDGRWCDSHQQLYELCVQHLGAPRLQSEDSGFDPPLPFPEDLGQRYSGLPPDEAPELQKHLAYPDCQVVKRRHADETAAVRCPMFTEVFGKYWRCIRPADHEGGCQFDNK